MKRTIKIIALLMAIISFHTCVQVDEEAGPNTNPVDLKDGKWTQIKNHKVDEKIVREQGEPCDIKFFFSFETGKEVPASERFTDKWDFGLQLNGDRQLFINHPDKDCRYCCPWVGSESPVLCTLVAKNFEEVTEAPDPKDYKYNRVRTVDDKLIDADFLKVVYRVQYDQEGLGIGFFYFMKDTEKGFTEGSGQRIIKLIPNRTFIIRTTTGKWAKLQIQSVYKDAPVEATSDSDPGYLTFRYYVQQDGSRNLDTR